MNLRQLENLVDIHSRIQYSLVLAYKANITNREYIEKHKHLLTDFDSIMCNIPDSYYYNCLGIGAIVQFDIDLILESYVSILDNIELFEKGEISKTQTFKEIDNDLSIIPQFSIHFTQEMETLSECLRNAQSVLKYIADTKPTPLLSNLFDGLEKDAAAIQFNFKYLNVNIQKIKDLTRRKRGLDSIKSLIQNGMELNLKVSE